MLVRSKLIFAVCVFLTLAGCNGGSVSTPGVPTPAEPIPQEPIQFSLQKMDKVTFNHFLGTDDGLFAATSAGVYRLLDGEWVNLTENQGWNVIDIVTFGSGHMLASVQQDGAFYLVESLDSGQEWTPVGSNFGGQEDSMAEQPLALAEKVHALEYDHELGLLYATGYDVLAISTDYGKTWGVVTGQWQGFARGLSALTIDFNSLKIWFGGQNAIEESVLKSHDISLLETTIHPSMSAMLSEPGTVKAIRFNPSDSNEMYATGEPGIITSKDGGSSWEALYINHESLFYFDLIIDPQQPEVMYTARWQKLFDEPQPFIFEHSSDGGQTWQSTTFNEEPDIFGGVYSMYADFDSDNTILYFGLYNGGVMQVTLSD